MERQRRGGVVLRVDGELLFVPAPTAVRVAAAPKTTAVPGGPPELLGVAVHEGAVIPVLTVGPARAEMVVCQHAGELVGIVGGEVVGSGTYEVVPDKPELVQVEEGCARPLDVATLYARVQAGARPGRFA
jgi:hypothetical protein